jgi:hypothetical protein
MFDIDRKERTSWGLTLTQPSTQSRLGGSFFLLRPLCGNSLTNPISLKTITASGRGAAGGRVVHRIAPRFAM